MQTLVPVEVATWPAPQKLQCPVRTPTHKRIDERSREGGREGGRERGREREGEKGGGGKEEREGGRTGGVTFPLIRFKLAERTLNTCC